jgi:hypothetical protein
MHRNEIAKYRDLSFKHHFMAEMTEEELNEIKDRFQSYPSEGRVAGHCKKIPRLY